MFLTLEMLHSESPWKQPSLCFFANYGHRLSMELDLQSLFGLVVHAETQQPPFPRIGVIYEGAIWSAKIDDISLVPPAHGCPGSKQKN